jgi:predicted transcriptional regulator
MPIASVMPVGCSAIAFLTNHAICVLVIAQDPSARIRDIAAIVGITERRCQHIINDLVDTGCIESRRVGRRNVYRVDSGAPLRIPFLDGLMIDSLLGLLPDHSDA